MLQIQDSPILRVIKAASLGLLRTNQRLGVTVSGSVFRPNFKKADLIADLWTRYRTIYISDEALQAVVNDLAAQAMKVCVGDRGFEEAVIGSARDELRKCIDDQVSPLAQGYGGLTVAMAAVLGD